MKNILYKIFPICLLTMGLTGCEEETKYRPLPEIVPLTMSINDNAFAMGEHLKVNINVEPDADGKEVVANEDFDIYLRRKPERRMLRMYSNSSMESLLFRRERNRFRWISR